MGSGDLNMKKSWHPQTLANQRRVAEVKLKAEEEAQRAAKLQKELREERQREEMDRLNATVTKKSINKLDWMYSAPVIGVPQTSDDLEAYLLGTKDAKDLIRDKEAAESIKQPDAKWKSGLFAFSNRNANNERDEMAKSLEDPLAEIKRREQAAAMQAMASRVQAKESKDKRSKEKRRSEKRNSHHETKNNDLDKKHKRSSKRHRHREDSESRSKDKQEASPRRKEHDRSRSHRRRSRSPDSHRSHHRQSPDSHRSRRSRSPKAY
ncbi:RNA-splicing factor [Coemansia sp. RSA 1822]|nr:RNA-splicing factor [Coemansia sp. RSA 638]KAJ2567763.1 RNA-splicing factor [Coemansia sp. RSA 1822]